MWTTVLVLALSVILEPIRISLVVLMLNRRRPMVQLLVFVCGGFTMGVGAGLVLLFILGATPLAGHFTVATVQIATGLIALVIAVTLATNVPAKLRRAPADTAVGGDGGVALLELTPPSRLQQLSVRAQQFLRGDSLYVAGISGLGAALPSANYMGAVAAILASGVAPVAQAQALLTFNVLAFTMAEIPLVSYLAAPQKTRAFTAALRDWLRSRSRRDVATLLAAGGCFMLLLGFRGL